MTKEKKENTVDSDPTAFDFSFHFDSVFFHNWLSISYFELI